MQFTYNGKLGVGFRTLKQHTNYITTWPVNSAAKKQNNMKTTTLTT